MKMKPDGRAAAELVTPEQSQKAAAELCCWSMVVGWLQGLVVAALALPEQVRKVDAGLVPLGRQGRRTTPELAAPEQDQRAATGLAPEQQFQRAAAKHVQPKNVQPKATTRRPQGVCR